MKLSIENERNNLIKSGKTRTETSIELYQKYYNLLFRFADDLKNSNIKKIVIEDGLLKLISKDDIIIAVPEGDIGVLAQWLILPEYENFEHDLLMKIANNIGCKKEYFTFFDIGANIGWYSLLFSKYFNNSKIHGFEPSGSTYKQFINNIKLNGYERIFAHNFGLAENVEKKEFYQCENMLTASSLADTLQGVKKKKIVCDFDTLDNFCKNNNVIPDLIKCDVEGAELLVLRGGHNTFANSKPALMIELLRKWTKCFNYHPNDVIDYMEDFGYLCFVAGEKGLIRFGRVDENTLETNYFFLHKMNHKEIIEKLTN